MNDESIDVNISFINTDYFSVSVRDGTISVIGRITKSEMEKFIKAQYGDLQICQCENLRDWSYINECNHYFHFEFTYVHELQHLLYALHIDSNLKI